MALFLNQPLVVATSQTIKFESLQLGRNPKGVLVCLVQFTVFDETGKPVKPIHISYEGDEYNEFWHQFSSGKFLYEELVAKKQIPVTVSDSVESDFVNA